MNQSMLELQQNVCSYFRQFVELLLLDLIKHDDKITTEWTYFLSLFENPIDQFRIETYLDIMSHTQQYQEDNIVVPISNQDGSSVVGIPSDQRLINDFISQNYISNGPSAVINNRLELPTKQIYSVENLQNAISSRKNSSERILKPDAIESSKDILNGENIIRKPWFQPQALNLEKEKQIGAIGNENSDNTIQNPIIQSGDQSKTSKQTNAWHQTLPNLQIPQRGEIIYQDTMESTERLPYTSLSHNDSKTYFSTSQQIETERNRYQSNNYLNIPYQTNGERLAPPKLLDKKKINNSSYSIKSQIICSQQEETPINSDIQSHKVEERVKQDAEIRLKKLFDKQSLKKKTENILRIFQTNNTSFDSFLKPEQTPQNSTIKLYDPKEYKLPATRKVQSQRNSINDTSQGANQINYYNDSEFNNRQKSNGGDQILKVNQNNISLNMTNEFVNQNINGLVGDSNKIMDQNLLHIRLLSDYNRIGSSKELHKNNSNNPLSNYYTNQDRTFTSKIV